MALELAAVGAADAADLALAAAPDIVFLVERIVAAHRRVDRLLDVPVHPLEVLHVGAERPDVVRPVLRAPDRALGIDEDPVRAGQRAFRRQRHVEFLHMPVGGIEPAHIGAAVGRVPDPPLRIAGGVVRRDLEPRHLVFGDDRVGGAALRPRLHHEVRILGIRPARGRQPMRELGFLGGRQPARIADVDERRAGPVGHAEDDLGPAGLVIMVAEDLLIFVAEVAVDLQRLLLLAGAGQVLQPFRAGELRRDLRERRQELARRHPQAA